MSTIFENLENALAGSQLAEKITSESGNLASVAASVANLISNPPDEFDTFLQQLAESSLPDLAVSGDLSSNLNAIQNILPADLGNISGSLVTALEGIEQTVGLNLINILADALETAQAIHRLLTADLTCGISSGSTTTTDSETSGSENASDTGSEDTSESTGGNSDTVSTIPNVQSAREEVDNIINFLNELPSPLNVESFLKWLHQTVNFHQSEQFFIRAIPVLDDLRDPLDSLLVWEEMAPDEILEQFAETLQAVADFIRQNMEAFLNTPLTELTALSGQFQETQLANIADGLTGRLDELRSAIESGDVSGTGPAVTEIENLLNQYETIRTNFETSVSDTLLALMEQLTSLPDDLESQVNHIISVLQPSGAWGDFTAFGLLPESVLPAGRQEGFDELENFLNTQLAFFRNLVDKIDMNALSGPLTTAANETRAAVEGLDQALVILTLEIQEKFTAVENLLNQLDTAAMITAALTAIEQFKNDVVQQLSDAFAPVRNALSQVVSQIDNAVDQFNPAAIIDELRNAIQEITGVLESPEVITALDTIGNALNTVTQLVEDLSFETIIDSVIAAINDLAEILNEIDTSLLGDTLEDALNTAFAALPQDITSITNPIIDEFSELIDTGPVPLIETLKDQPQRLLDKVREFEPGNLLGETLSTPYQALLTELETFQPSQLLEKVASELNTFKDRLRQNANPALALEPLKALHQQLLEGFDSFRPGDIIQPLEERVNLVINSIIETLPADELLEQFNNLINFIQDTLGLGDRFVALLQRINDLASGFTNAGAQLQTWIGTILSKMDALTDTSPLEAPLVNVKSAVESTQSAALTTIYEGLINPLQTRITTLNPEARLADLVQAYHAIPGDALDALPDSPEKSAIINILERFDPVEPLFNAVYRTLADLKTTLVNTNTGLAIILHEWDARYHDDNGILANFRHTEATAAQLREWVEDALEDQFNRPFEALFEMLELNQSTISSFFSAIQALITDLQSKLADLLLGPDSLTGIHDAARQLIHRLRDFNLGFLTDSLDGLFDTVRGKFEAVNPANLQTALDSAFTEMLDNLDLSQAIPLDSLAQLDSDYREVLNKLQALDPQTVLTDVIQPEYESAVIPLVEKFDLTPLLTGLAEKLRTLDDELREGMGEVNVAYQAFLRSAPGSISDSASVPA